MGPTRGVVAEPGGYQRLAQLGRPGTGQPDAVAPGAPAASRGPFLPGADVADHPGHGLPGHLGGDRDRIVRYAVDVIDRPVDRVEHPTHLPVVGPRLAVLLSRLSPYSSPRLSPYSSPRTRSSGRCSCSRVTISRSTARSAAVTRSVAVVLVAIAPISSARRRRAQLGRLPRGGHGQVEQRCRVHDSSSQAVLAGRDAPARSRGHARDDRTVQALQFTPARVSRTQPPAAWDQRKSPD